MSNDKALYKSTDSLVHMATYVYIQVSADADERRDSPRHVYRVVNTGGRPVRQTSVDGTKPTTRATISHVVVILCLRLSICRGERQKKIAPFRFCDKVL